MAYQFAGFLAPSNIEIVQPSALPAGAICRCITEPFIGIGVRLPSMLGSAPSADQVNTLAAALGIAKAQSWLYLTYDTWGRIDSVYALGVQDGKAFGPIDDSDLNTVETTFVEVMARIGIGSESALRFKPFERGFWAPQA